VWPSGLTVTEFAATRFAGVLQLAGLVPGAPMHPAGVKLPTLAAKAEPAPTASAPATATPTTRPAHSTSPPSAGAANAGQRARLLAGAAAPASWALGLSESGSGVYAAGFAAMNAIYWLTAELAAEGSLFLAVDDAHWADSSSLRALTTWRDESPSFRSR
jgi:hypothetical protein